MCTAIRLEGFLDGMAGGDFTWEPGGQTIIQTINAEILSAQPRLTQSCCSNTKENPVDYLFCVLTLSYSSSRKKNTNNLAFHHTMSMTVCSTLSTGSNLLITQLLQQPTKVKTSCYKTVSQDGASDPICLSEWTNSVHLELRNFPHALFSFSLKSSFTQLFSLLSKTTDLLNISVAFSILKLTITIYFYPHLKHA